MPEELPVRQYRAIPHSRKQRFKNKLVIFQMNYGNQLGSFWSLFGA